METSVVDSAPTGPQIPLLRSVPPTLDVLVDSLRSLGYDVQPLRDCSFEKDGRSCPPTLALIPLSSRMRFEDVKQAIATFKDRAKAAPSKVIAAYSGRIPITINELHAVGVDAIFQSPFEDQLLINKLYELAPIATNPKQLTLDQLLPIPVGDIEKMTTVPCDLFLYLPMNMKAILYVEKNTKPDERTVKKVRDKKLRTFYIRRSDISRFQDYGRKYVAELQDGETKGTAEASKKIAGRLGGLMGDFFSSDGIDEDNAKQMIDNLKSFVQDISTSESSQAGLERSAGELAAQRMTNTSHCQNVAAYCALFGLTLGLTDAERLRMGGVLHDIGLMDVGPELAGRDLLAMSSEQQARYRQHPVKARESLAKKNLDLPKEVLDMIQSHHEHTDGSGFPMGLKGADISPYAKVCAFANEFDKLTSVRPGYPQLTPKEAIRRIAGLDGRPPLGLYDPNFHRPLVDKFLHPADGPAAAAEGGGVSSPGLSKSAQEALLDSYMKKPNDPNNPRVTVQRLLKTEQFARPDFIPNLTSEDPRILEAMNEASEALKKHFASGASE